MIPKSSSKFIIQTTEGEYRIGLYLFIEEENVCWLAVVKSIVYI